MPPFTPGPLPAITSRRKFLVAATGSLAAVGLVALPESGVAETVTAAGKTTVFSVTTFGAKGDGTSLDSVAINRAIEAVEAAGGGTLWFPAGVYLCFSIRLKSKVTLHLDSGAVLLAADSPMDGKTGYDLAESNGEWEPYQDYGHNHWHNSLIWGEGLENIGITGSGLIWGKGLAIGWNHGNDGPVAGNPGVGNKAIALKNCRNVLLRDFAILHGGHFGILATGVDNFTIDNLLIDTNRDGMDIDCCRNVRISRCSVNSPGDDGICLKSSYALGYARSTEMVTISDCLVSGSFKEGTLLDATCKRFAAEDKTYRTGRIKFGTESNGGFKNITITNCVFDGCHGFALETVDGALLEDVTISNITMRDNFDGPIFLRLGARMRGPKGVPVGKLRRVMISDVVCHNSASNIVGLISGIPGHSIEDIRLSNIYIHHRGGGTREMAAFRPAESENQYPEPGMFGPMPAHGFYLRHVDGIEMRDVEITYDGEDARPAFVLDDVRRSEFFRIKTARRSDAPMFALHNVSDFSMGRCRPLPDLEIEKAEDSRI